MSANHSLSFIAILLAATMTAVVTRAATCAVLPFQARETDMDASVPAAVHARFAAAVSGLPGCRLQAPAATARLLEEAGLKRLQFATDQAFVVAAGRALQVEQAICGTVGRQPNGLFLSTSLFDAASGRLLRAAHVESTNPAQTADALCRSNLDRLYGPAYASATPPAQPAVMAAAAAPASFRRASAGLPATRPDPTVGGGERDRPWQEGGSGLAGLLHDRLVLGWRLHDPTLDETQRSYYIGTIDQLGEVEKEQELYLQVFPIRWLGLGLGYDRVSARTHTDSPDDHVDGTVSVKGVVLELYGRVGVDEIVAWFDPELARRHPWMARITPYIGFGRAYLSGGFDADTWWSEGYPSRQEWISMGGGSDPRRAGTRRIVVGDDTASVSTLGVAVELYKGLGVDLSYRRVTCGVSAQYRYPFNAIRDTGSFDLSHDSIALGLRYAF